MLGEGGEGWKFRGSPVLWRDGSAKQSKGSTWRERGGGEDSIWPSTASRGWQPEAQQPGPKHRWSGALKNPQKVKTLGQCFPPVVPPSLLSAGEAGENADTSAHPGRRESNSHKLSNSGLCFHDLNICIRDPRWATLITCEK